MTRQEKKDLATKKSFEVSYILYRIGERIRQRVLGDKLQNLGISLLEDISAESLDSAKKVISTIGQLLRLGGETDLIHKQSVEVVLAELNKLNSAIAELGQDEKVAELPIKEFGNVSREKPATKNSYNSDIQSGNNRQDDIFAVIRQLGSCRMKDIQERMQGISERTLRYDLGKLVDKGVVERLGSGGPNTFYRVRQNQALQVVEENTSM